MSADDFAILRREMLAEISARASQLRDTIGKAALEERVMAAMGKVPRHEFVPVELQPLPMPTFRFRSAARRRSRSRSSSR